MIPDFAELTRRSVPPRWSPGRPGVLMRGHIPETGSRTLASFLAFS